MATLGVVGAAGATITPTRSAPELATVAVVDPATLGAPATFDAIPPNNNPHAVSTSALAAFPRHGSSYAILSNGESTFAENAQSFFASQDNGGTPVRGDTDDDVTILRIPVNVPLSANCLSLDFRFLSEEYPTFVGGRYNDAFIAEVDSSDWSTSGTTISAPNNFAFDPAGNPISVNAAGQTSMTAGAAGGTAYGGATPLLRASQPVAPGSHTLYLSIFDQGDPTHDSAAFVDNLVFTNRAPENCTRGAILAQPPAPPPDTDMDTDMDGVPDSTDACPTVPADTANGCPLPAPQLGRTVNAEPVNGEVFVGIPGAAAGASRGSAHASQVKGIKFVPLEQARQIPIGSFFDTRKGEVRIRSARDTRGRTQSGDFTAGIFQVLQSRRRSARGLTELRLKGASFRGCRRRARRSEALASRLSRRTIRRLRARASGRFRTRGRHSAATVRGTTWDTTDRCDGTLTRVRRGRVAVRNFRRKRTILVRAGKSYLARAPR